MAYCGLMPPGECFQDRPRILTIPPLLPRLSGNVGLGENDDNTFETHAVSLVFGNDALVFLKPSASARRDPMIRVGKEKGNT